MAKLLFHQGEIDVRGNEMTGEGMLQCVGMPFFCRQTSFTGNRPEEPEELRPIKPSALLTGEQLVGAIGRTFSQPFPECPVFVQKRLAAMFGHCLCGAE